MTPLTPRDSPSDSRIVVDCPQCHRTIWAGTLCHHGAPILLSHGAPVEVGDGAVLESEDTPKKKLKGGLGK